MKYQDIQCTNCGQILKIKTKRGKRGRDGPRGFNGAVGPTGATTEIPDDLSIDCLTLGTTGGTATPICYYEEYSTSITFAFGGIYAGITTLKAIRMNQTVTLEIGPLFIESPDMSNPEHLVSTDPLLERFRPDTSADYVATLNVASTTSEGFVSALFQIYPNGDIMIYKFDPPTGAVDFSITDILNTFVVSITYQTAAL